MRWIKLHINSKNQEYVGCPIMIEVNAIKYFYSVMDGEKFCGTFIGLGAGQVIEVEETSSEVAHAIMNRQDL